MVIAPGHAAQRAAERHGLEPTVADFVQAALDIANAKSAGTAAATFLWTAPSGAEHWRVRLCGKMVRVAYDAATTNIITVLPEDGRVTLGDVMPEAVRRMAGA